MRAISLPFRFDGYGVVATTTAPERIWADRARTVISTTPGERVMRPDFGCPMPESLFDAMTSVPELVESDVSAAFSKWLPDLAFTSLDVAYADETEGLIEVVVAYSIPSLQQNADPARYSITV